MQWYIYLECICIQCIYLACVHIQCSTTEILLSATEKNKILTFATTWMNLECIDIMLIKISQMELDKDHMI